MRTYKVKHVAAPDSGARPWVCTNCGEEHPSGISVKEVAFSDTEGGEGTAYLCAASCLLQFLDMANTARSALRAVEMYLRPGVVTQEEIQREIELLQASPILAIPDGEVIH